MTPHDGSLLPDSDWNELQNIADRFAAARLKGPVEDWLPYVPPMEDRLHRSLLLELVKIDLELAWRAGTGPRVESYAQRFPELVPMPLELIVEEYRVRRRFGDNPPLDEYRQRYPDSFTAFERRALSIPVEAPIAATTPKSPASATPAAPVFPEGYTPLNLLGRGNFGEVWRAEAPGGIEVAIKVVTQPIDNEAAKREQQALELIKKLQHPALLSTLAFWILGNRLVIALELADCCLRDRLRECQQQGLPGIPANELLSYFRDAAVGLDYLHWQGVLHRDIKPENILLKKGYAKVADFGLALARAQNRSMMSVSFAGTPAFMAPEIWEGKAGKHSDQYSLAFTYAELRLGRRPLAGDDFYQVMKNTLEKDPDLGDLPAAEQAVLRRALAKKAVDRFENCQEFIEALERAVSPDGKSQPRRPEVAPRMSSSASTRDDTERSLSPGGWEPARHNPSATIMPSEQRSLPNSGTAVGGNSAKSKANVWKPGASSKPKRSSSKPLLFGIVGVLVIGGAIAAAVIFWPHNDPERTTSAVTTAQSTPSTATTTQQELAKEAYLPSQFAAADGAKLLPFAGKQYYERIVYRLKDGRRATFVLIRPLPPSDLRPFYMAESKVSNAFYREFASNAGSHGLPALNITFDRASQFAAKLGGSLPSAAQWDYAAGFMHREGRAGPAKGPAIAIDRDAPMPVGEAADDVSPLGIRDLAGNGREFTRDTLLAGGEKVIVLRGRNFKALTPLTYEELTREQDPKHAQTQYPNKASPYTGFRVVIEL